MQTDVKASEELQWGNEAGRTAPGWNRRGGGSLGQLTSRAVAEPAVLYTVEGGVELGRQ